MTTPKAFAPRQTQRRVRVVGIFASLFSKAVITKAELESLSDTRLFDAQALFAAARFSAAYYLSGYAMELGIKACIAKLFQADSIPDRALVNSVYSHNLDELRGIAGIKKTLADDMKNDPALFAA